MKRNPIVQQASNRQSDPESNRRRLKNILSQSMLITQGDPVDRYLQERGINLEIYPNCLRYHSKLPYYHDGIEIGKFPAMIALIQDLNGKGVTLHRTYLGDGCKANVPQPKKLIPPVIPGSSLGGAIRVCPSIANKTLVCAEGIETAIAIHLASGLPTWATVSATGMERVILPQEINVDQRSIPKY
ncbi:MAG: hypothetical protein QM652_05990 [Legionella sp.]|uniref:DUF7146 domain-containing protein n=1 Tax=Legionella sp. TaxID=459 RepID=UPI0039E65FC6